MSQPAWGPSGETVYERTYSRVKPDGERETWPETVERVAKGNMALVHGDRSTWDPSVEDEYNDIVDHMLDFRVIPAGRHLWASGVKGRQYLMNCWTAGWGDKLSDHFSFAFLRLMEGGGVGANYSHRFLRNYGRIHHSLRLHIVCDPGHPDYQEMFEAGVLSKDYDPEWEGSFEVQDSREGWADAMVDLIDTHMQEDDPAHADRVYDVSRVRGRGSRLKTFGGIASGPAPFARMMHTVNMELNLVRGGKLDPIGAMEIDHAIAECVVSGGNRRSARMSMLHWNDPDIFEFIECKKDTGRHWTTNISVEVDDEFFTALEQGDEHALMVHAAVVTGMLDNGEPGYFNVTKANERELEPVYTTNPCGEITLQPWESCNLGHVNLEAFIDRHGFADLIAMGKAHRLMARFLIRATYADINDPKSRAVQDRNRRIGVGHLGVQGFLAKSGLSYSRVAEHKSEARRWVRDVLTGLYDSVRDEAREYAFRLRIPEPVKVTTVAPTGSIAKLPGATEGIHPIYARYFIQRIRFNSNDPRQQLALEAAQAEGFKVEVDQYEPSGNTFVVEYPTKHKLVDEVEAIGRPVSNVESANELTVRQMLAIQELWQSAYADNAVSFTVNVEPGQDPYELDLALRDYLPRLKGTTIMVDGTRPQAPLERIDKELYASLTKAVYETVGETIDMECATGACPIR